MHPTVSWISRYFGDLTLSRAGIFVGSVCGETMVFTTFTVYLFILTAHNVLLRISHHPHKTIHVTLANSLIAMLHIDNPNFKTLINIKIVASTP